MVDPGSTHTATEAPVRARIRVRWMVKGLGPGGTEQLLLLVARQLDHERFAVRIGYLLEHKDHLVGALREEGLEVDCLGWPRLRDPGWFRRLRRTVDGAEVDVVHAHSPVSAVVVRLAVATLPRRRRPSVVTTEHSLWSGHARPTAWANARTARLDDRHLVVSEAIRETLPVGLRDDAEVVVHGVDVDAVRAAGADRDEVRRELDIDPGELVVGTVANLRPVKAYPDLLRAARIVVDARRDVTFVTVGQGPQEAEIRALRDELGLAGRVRMLGFRRDAVRIMSACDVFCLPSLHEGLPVALMEALALGLPVVATGVGGVREVVEDGVEGRLVPPARPDQLASVLLAVLGDEEARASMGRRASVRGSSLSIGSAVRRTEEIYSELARTKEFRTKGSGQDIL